MAAPSPIRRPAPPAPSRRSPSPTSPRRKSRTSPPPSRSTTSVPIADPNQLPDLQWSLDARTLLAPPPSRSTASLPIADPNQLPDLQWSLDARILLALRERLLADNALRMAFVQEDQIAILEMASLLRTETIQAAPCLALSILADEERETTSGYGATYTTVVQLALVTAPPARWGDTADLLRSRIVAQIRRVIRREAGVLREPDGDPPTEGVSS